MVKYLFIVINSFCLFIFGLFSGDNGITVTSNIPSRMVAGQDVSIEIKVVKGGMGGFAKLQLELPEGIILKEADEMGANYSYNNGLAKWVWAALPMESEIIVKITLFVESSALGAKTISSKYSYVENNVKQVVEMLPAEVTVLPPGSDINDTPIVSTSRPDSLPPTTIAQVPTVSSGIEPASTITVDRSISAGAEQNEFLITLKIKKNATRGFARYSDDIADGIIVKAAKTDGGSFSVADGKIKFVWVNVPEKDELEISYTISGSTSDAVMLGGEYSYLEDNQSKKVKVPMETIAFQAQQTKNEAKNNESIVEKLSTSNENSESEKITKIAEKAVEETVTEKIAESTVQKKESSMKFVVQVGAFANAKVTAQRLKKKFNIKESIKSEMQGGFSKFMVGSHEGYKEARNQRESMKTINGIKSAFVVAYNQGSRITVQEALMITNQKWFK
ncbi:SPOR domain-containing protein [Aurantibacillus circumpalustris]|uniref:SPOR domain-containing protein n=1 Tax=Aurantibacillus circumpalustris TaxID=3036359 RepID=UPI00295ABCF1|nr:SPOR domain-containing protein [Aurantibacillus circumpalustris]